MTRAEAEREILTLLKKAWETAKAYEPKSGYLTMTVLDEDGEGYFSFFNEYFENEKIKKLCYSEMNGERLNTGGFYDKLTTSEKE